MQFANRLLDVFGIFQSRSVRSRAQMTTFRCVADRIACQMFTYVTKVGCGVGAPPETRRPRPPTPPPHPKTCTFTEIHENTGFLCGPSMLWHDNKCHVLSYAWRNVALRSAARLNVVIRGRDHVQPGWNILYHVRELGSQLLSMAESQKM